MAPTECCYVGHNVYMLSVNRYLSIDRVDVDWVDVGKEAAQGFNSLPLEVFHRI